MSKKSSLEETGWSLDKIFVCSDNLGQNIWKKIKKSSKIGQNYKALISTFASFLTAIAKNYILWERLDNRLCLYPKWRFF